MKILWFCNTPANADEYFNSELKGTGGWLKSLDKEMQNKVKLHVAFYHNKDCSAFKYEGTTYYPIVRKRTIRDKVLNKLGIIKVLGEEDKLKYVKIIKDVQPDVILIHGTENPFISILNGVEIPIIVSIQGNITVCNHKFYSGLEKKYLTFEFKKNKKKFEKQKVIETKYLANVQYIAGRTDWDKRITRILAPQSDYFVSNEILRDSFYKEKWVYHHNEKFTIFTTNGNNFYKGFETIIEAALLLKKQNLEFDWRIAGIDKKSSIVRITKKYLKIKRIPTEIKLLGNLNEKNLVKELLSSNVYVMPSHIENSPNNLCEAMILGMPCIATYVGGTGSLLADGKDGILVQDGDPWSMAGALLEVKNNYNDAIYMGINARKRAMIKHAKESIKEQLLAIYSEIVNDK